MIILQNFLAEGYYTNKVIPQKLNLKEKDIEVEYLKPIGLDESIQDVIMDLAYRAMGDWKPEETTLMLLGHGSTKSKTSKDTLLEHIEALLEKTDFAQIDDLWLEEPPFIKDWRDVVKSKQVLFIPYLIADGQHGGWDIPEMIGMERDIYAPYKAHEVDNYALKLTTALGKSPKIVDLMLRQLDQL